jgi:hypothetical protein
MKDVYDKLRIFEKVWNKKQIEEKNKIVHEMLPGSL